MIIQYRIPTKDNSGLEVTFDDVTSIHSLNTGDIVVYRKDETMILDKACSPIKVVLKEEDTDV